MNNRQRNQLLESKSDTEEEGEIHDSSEEDAGREDSNSSSSSSSSSDCSSDDDEADAHSGISNTPRDVSTPKKTKQRITYRSTRVTVVTDSAKCVSAGPESYGNETFSPKTDAVATKTTTSESTDNISTVAAAVSTDLNPQTTEDTSTVTDAASDNTSTELRSQSTDAASTEPNSQSTATASTVTDPTSTETKSQSINAAPDVTGAAPTEPKSHTYDVSSETQATSVETNAASSECKSQSVDNTDVMKSQEAVCAIFKSQPTSQPQLLSTAVSPSVPETTKADIISVTSVPTIVQCYTSEASAAVDHIPHETYVYLAHISIYSGLIANVVDLFKVVTYIFLYICTGHAMREWKMCSGTLNIQTTSQTP